MNIKKKALKQLNKRVEESEVKAEWTEKKQ